MEIWLQRKPLFSLKDQATIKEITFNEKWGVHTIHQNTYTQEVWNNGREME